MAKENTVYHNPTKERVFLPELDLCLQPLGDMDFADTGIPMKQVKAHPNFKYAMKNGYLKEGEYVAPKKTAPKPVKKETISFDPSYKSPKEQVIFSVERPEFIDNIENNPDIKKNPRLVREDAEHASTPAEKIEKGVAREEALQQEDENFRALLKGDDPSEHVVGLKKPVKATVIDTTKEDNSDAVGDPTVYTKATLLGKEYKELLGISKKYGITERPKKDTLISIILKAQQKVHGD